MNKLKLVDLNAPWVAGRKFSMDGKEYQPGDPVDLSKLPPRQAKRLVKFRFVHEDTNEQVKPEGKKPAAEQTVSTEPAPVEQEQPVVEQEQPVVEQEQPVVEQPAVNTVKLHHVGGGYYEAQDAEGKNVLPDKVQGKDNAKMVIESMGLKIS